MPIKTTYTRKPTIQEMDKLADFIRSALTENDYEYSTVEELNLIVWDILDIDFMLSESCTATLKQGIKNRSSYMRKFVFEIVSEWFE